MRPPLKRDRNCKQRTTVTQAASSKRVLCRTLTVREVTLLPTTSPHLLLTVLQQSPGFPEIEPHVHMDWNSQASNEASTTQPSNDADAEPDNAFLFRQQEQSLDNAHCSNLIWESEGLVPQLQLPVLVPQGKPPPNLLEARASPHSSPRDMPSGPSIATARVHHPLSSIESAALTQLRAELNALFLESQNGPDLSLVPLPRQLSQATAAKATSEAARKVKMVRPNRLQPRPAAPVLRRNSRRRHTIDTTTSHQAPHLQPARALQQKQLLRHLELSQREPSQPAPCQHDMTDAATCPGVDSQSAEAALHRSSHAFGAGVHGIAAGAAQASPKGKRYARSNSWAAGSASASNPTRVGVTHSSTASTSYNK